MKKERVRGPDEINPKTVVEETLIRVDQVDTGGPKVKVNSH